MSSPRTSNSVVDGDTSIKRKKKDVVCPRQVRRRIHNALDQFVKEVQLEELQYQAT